MAKPSKAEPVVDANRISHGDVVARSLHMLRMQKMQNDMIAGRDADLEALERGLEQADDTLARCVVSVPDDWLLNGVKFGDEGWIRNITQAHYDELIALAFPMPGEKKA